MRYCQRSTLALSAFANDRLRERLTVNLDGLKCVKLLVYFITGGNLVDQAFGQEIALKLVFSRFVLLNAPQARAPRAMEVFEFPLEALAGSCHHLRAGFILSPLGEDRASSLALAFARARRVAGCGV